MISSKLFLLFVIYSVFGWIMEVLYVGIFYEHRFINRGFLHGPVCPIYGFGGLIVIIGLYRWRESWLELFIASFFLCSVLEYFASWAMEKLFKTKWWDYSNKFLNLNGRVCLLNSTLFGLAGLIFTHFINPPIEKIIMSLSDNLSITISRIVFCIFAVDMIITLHRLVDFTVTMERFKEFNENILERFNQNIWFRKENFSSMLESVRKRISTNREEFTYSFIRKFELFEKSHWNIESFLKRFPTMNSKQYSFTLKHLRIKLVSRMKSKKENNK